MKGNMMPAPASGPEDQEQMPPAAAPVAPAADPAQPPIPDASTMPENATDQEDNSPEAQNFAQMFSAGIAKLTPPEQVELDAYVTPRLADLMAKMFGSPMRDVLAPFIQDEDYDEGMDDGGDDNAPSSNGTEAVPYTSTPLQNVKAMGYK